MLQFSLDLRLPHLLVLVLALALARRRRTTSTGKENETLKQPTALGNGRRDRPRNRHFRQCTENPTSSQSLFLRHLSRTYQRPIPTRAGTRTKPLPFKLTRNLHATLLNRNMSTLLLHDTSMRLRCHHPRSSASAQLPGIDRLKETIRTFAALPVCITHRDQLRHLSVSTHLPEPISQLETFTQNLHGRHRSRLSARRTP
jgi:hypothetical protein